MANLTGVPGPIVFGSPGAGTNPTTLARQDLTAVIDSTAIVAVGTRAYDKSGNEYIYLAGVASTAANSVVTFNRSSGATALIAANGIGPVAIAMAATVASTFGWYQVYGVGTASTDAGIVSGAALYIDGTSGRVDDTVVAGDLVLGMFARSTDTANVTTVELNYPQVTDTIS